MKRRQYCNIGRSFKRIDLFSESFQMELDVNDSAYRSYMGAFCTIVVAFFVLAFTLTKLQTLINRKDVDIMSLAEDSAIDEDEVFSYSNGLFLAAALTEYNTDPRLIEQREYGELLIE